jgi:hypothetical protein
MVVAILSLAAASTTATTSKAIDDLASRIVAAGVKRVEGISSVMRVTSLAQSMAPVELGRSDVVLRR